MQQVVVYLQHKLQLKSSAQFIFTRKGWNGIIKLELLMQMNPESLCCL